MFGKAFENDSKLSQDDKLRGMIIEGPDDDDDASSVSRNWSPTLTATQEKWRRAQKQGPDNASLQGKSAEMDFYLTGVSSSKDPSSDLYGAKENISSRDKVGQAVPQEPTVSAISVEFLAENKCRCTSTTSFKRLIRRRMESIRRWKTSALEFRYWLLAYGADERVDSEDLLERRGGKVYTDIDDDTIQTGRIYGEAELTTNARGDMIWNDGIQKLSSLWLLVQSRMLPCGKSLQRLPAS
jgi:hypothetical protein